MNYYGEIYKKNVTANKIIFFIKLQSLISFLIYFEFINYLKSTFFVLVLIYSSFICIFNHQMSFPMHLHHFSFCHVQFRSPKQDASSSVAQGVRHKVLSNGPQRRTSGFNILPKVAFPSPVLRIVGKGKTSCQ